ncbi:MAG TPA: thioesterase family protein [Acidimicrobiales bacterium]|nr:thioesterase family protein [Acidimicrobiales bacterium]
MGSPFLEDTAVEAVAPGRYRAELPDRWNLRPLPQGGVITAVALRAMAQELADPGQKLRTLHTTFVAQVADGPLEVAVETLRRGRSMSHLRADVRNPGTEHGHLTTAVFGRSRQGFDFVDLEPPTEIPPPDACPSFRTPPPDEFAAAWAPMPFWEQVEGRSALGHAPWDDFEPDRAERVMWYHFDEPPMLADGTLDPYALVVLVDSMPGAVAEKLGPGPRVWFAPSVDLTVHVLEECRSPWVLAHNRARHAGDGYASADMALWDCGEDGRGAPRLVAYGTQVFLFTFLE